MQVQSLQPIIIIVKLYHNKWRRYDDYKNGDDDLIVMNIDAFEKREQMLKLRERVLKAEQERIEGQPTTSVLEARRRLRERENEI